MRRGHPPRPTDSASPTLPKKSTSISSPSPRTDARSPACWQRRGTKWIRPGHRTASSSRSSPTGRAAWASGCAAATGNGSGRWCDRRTLTTRAPKRSGRWPFRPTAARWRSFAAARRRRRVWLIPTTGGTPVKMLTDDPGFSYHDAPAWSPDGDWMRLYAQHRSGILTRQSAGRHQGDRDAPRSRRRRFRAPSGRPMARGSPPKPMAGSSGSRPMAAAPKCCCPNHRWRYDWVDARRLVALVSEASRSATWRWSRSTR